MQPPGDANHQITSTTLNTEFTDPSILASLDNRVLIEARIFEQQGVANLTDAYRGR